MKPAPSLPALFLSTIKKLPPQPASFSLETRSPVETLTLGRAASGGALAPEPPRATRSQPETIWTVPQNPLFFIFFELSQWTGPVQASPVQARLSPDVQNPS